MDADLADDREMEYVNLTIPFGQYPVQPTSPSADLAMEMGTDPTKVQVMRASFFGMMDDDADEYETKSGKQTTRFNHLKDFSFDCKT